MFVQLTRGAINTEHITEIHWMPDGSINVHMTDGQSHYLEAQDAEIFEDWWFSADELVVRRPPKEHTV